MLMSSAITLIVRVRLFTLMCIAYIVAAQNLIYSGRRNILSCLPAIQSSDDRSTILPVFVYF